jgi:hypothetical protein
VASNIVQALAVGMYDASDDRNNGWRWSVAWTMAAIFFAIHIPFQKGNTRAIRDILPARIDGDDADPYDEFDEDVTTDIPK